jgi:hypothetical protein
MANTYEAIATVEVGSGGAANIEFTSIPATYTDLKVVCSLRGTYAGITDDVNVYFNGTNTNRSAKLLYGTGAAAASVGVNDHIDLYPGSTATASTFSNGEFYIPNYTSSNFKSMSGDSVSENNATTAYTDLTASLWSATAAITSMTIYPQSGSWVEHSSATLYGISNS